MNKPNSNANNGFAKSLNSGLEQRNQANQSEVKTIKYVFLSQVISTVTGTMFVEHQAELNRLKKCGFKSYRFQDGRLDVILVSSYRNEILTQHPDWKSI